MLIISTQKSVNSLYTSKENDSWAFVSRAFQINHIEILRSNSLLKSKTFLVK